MSKAKRNKFLSDLDTGKAGEKIVKEFFSENQITLDGNSGKYKDLENDLFSIEVKYDKYAKKSGNLAFEFFNPKTCKYSGLATTQSDLWVQIVDTQDGPSLLSCSTHRLITFVKENKPFRVAHSIGDGNASILLYPISEISCLTLLKDVLDFPRWLKSELEVTPKYVLEKEKEDVFKVFLR